MIEERLFKFEAEGQEFANFLRSLEQSIQTVKGQDNFRNRMLFLLFPEGFSDQNRFLRKSFKRFLLFFRYVPERLRPKEFPQYGTSDWMRELGKVTAEIKGKMMVEGTIMISYQPLGEYPNFFRSIISNQVKKIS